MAVFKGAGVAIITPMIGDGKINYECFEKLIEDQIAGETDAIIVCGTTGEAPTLDDDEHLEAISFTVAKTAGRIPVIAGTGSNNTAHAIMMSKEAQKRGADGVLLVAPYYNKATQGGLIASFTAIANSLDIPCILYNVPSRTGINIEPETYAKIADHPNIAGIKEANSNISKIVHTAQLIGDKMDIYSGNDDQIVPILSMGGQGVISVLSNPAPKLTMEICEKFFAGDVKGAADLQCRMLPLINALFCETNPIPVKAAMSAMGFCENYVRLPLVPMEDAHREYMFSLMRELGLI